MRVNLLGPVQVVVEGRVSVPSAPKVRQVLSLLAVNADRVVSAEQLTEELWAGRPPPSAANIVQTYVHQLRKQYRLARDADDDGPALLTSPAGYALRLGQDGVDTVDAERLAARARAELQSGSVERAAGTLRAALRLWRGPVLSEATNGPLLRIAGVSLEERRRELTRQRIDADLALGRHHELIGELTGLVADQPADESLKSRLILALYRAGRRLDALRVYQDARQVLARELGLDPMPELQRLHQAVLLADPTLDVSAAVEVAAAAPPDQLPPDVAWLVGRRAEIAAASAPLTAARREAAPVVVVAGSPGSGKTALCVHIAHQLRHHYPDGLLYARLSDDDGEPLGAAEVLEGFLRAAGYPPGAIPDGVTLRASLFRRWCAGRRVLVTLDDVSGAGQIGSLLPTGRFCGTLIAARRRFCDPAITAVVGVGPLDHADAVRLVTNALGADRVRRQAAAVDELVDFCDRLPLPLREATDRLELQPHRPVREYARRTWSTPGTGLRDSLIRTLRLLPGELRAALDRLVFHGDPPPAEELVEEIAIYGLVQIGVAAGTFVYRIPPPYARAVRDLGVGVTGTGAGVG